MKNNILKINLSVSIIASIIIFTIQPLFAQFVKDKSIVEAGTINPDLYHATSKKLIQTSNYLQWGFVKDNISRMEALHPDLDGVATGINGPFDKNFLMLRGDKLWTEDDVQLRTVSQIKWGKYTDNFVILYFGDSLDFDFFNDSKWKIILSNARMVSKMLKAGRFKGVFFDNENYFEPSHAWQFDPAWYPNHTFEQVKAKCRERGKAFMNALQSNISTPITILNFFQFGDFWNDYDKNTSREILWMPFMDGVLEAARPNDILVDGNEGAYWYHETSMFTDIYNEFRVNRFPKYGAKDLQHKYKTQVQIGHGIYPNLYYDKFNRWPFKHTNEEQDTWWKHQLYNALLTSDKYVWIWSEKWDWWGNGGMALTPNFSSIIKDVKSKINSQQSLNFDMVNHSDNWKINLVKPVEKWHVATSPTVVITSPINKSKSKSNITINTTVSNNASKVEFYVNSMRVGIDSVAPYSVNISGLASGTYTLFARAFDSKNEHTTSPPVLVTVISQETRSAISSDKKVLVNGKPVFLNGIYYNGKEFTPEQRRADLDLFKSIGMNVIDASQISDWPNINSFFEEAAARNIYLACEVMFGPNGKGHDFIPKYKDKAAVIAWNTADDSHRQFTVEQMRERNNGIKAIDPNRLTYQTVYKPTIALPYLPVTDMVWPYTYPVFSGVSGADFINVQNLMDSLTSNYDGCYIAIPQAYDWATHPRMGKPDYRFPDVKEYRNFVYQYLVYGVKGIVAYSFTDAGRLPEVAPDLWEAIKNGTKEINTLTPFLLNGSFKRISTGDKYLQIATWKLKDTYCIVIVNVSNTTTKSVSFSLPVSSKATLKPMFPKQPFGSSINNKIITGTFKPMDVHVYKLE